MTAFLDFFCLFSVGWWGGTWFGLDEFGGRSFGHTIDEDLSFFPLYVSICVDIFEDHRAEKGL